MHWSTPSPADVRVTLVRPLLNLRKRELKVWADDQKISFREDATNASADILRNRIRHKLLPLLRREYQPGIDNVLLRESDLLRDETDYIAAEATQAIRSRKKFDAMPVALQRRVLHAELVRAGITPDFKLIEQLRISVGLWASVDANLFCRRDERGGIETKTGAAADFNPGGLRVDITGTHSVRFQGMALTWAKRTGALVPKTKAGREFFDAAEIGKTVILRHWRPGDRFQPIGTKCPVKLQDLFTNQKIPRERRHTLVVATTSSGEVFWVERLRIGERFKVKPATKQRLEWKWRRG